MVCHDCERGASPTPALAVNAWNDACWASPQWNAARERERWARMDASMREYREAFARALAEDIDRRIMESLS